MNEDPDLFDRAAAAAKALPQKPDNDTMLQLYALFKQGSVGDIRGEKPGFFDFVGTAKYEAWDKLRGLDQAAARRRYVDLVCKLGGKF